VFLYAIKNIVFIALIYDNCNYISPGIPPPPPIGGATEASSLISTNAHSVV